MRHKMINGSNKSAPNLPNARAPVVGLGELAQLSGTKLLAHQDQSAAEAVVAADANRHSGAS